MRKPVVLLFLGASLIPPALAAQARQPFSLQGSALYTVEQLGSAGVTGGAGAEVQLRYNPGRVSFGVGGQFSHHSSQSNTLDLSGVFVEPRLAIDAGSDHVTPYIAGRLALLRQTSEFADIPKFSSNGTAVGAGGGLLIHLSPRVNLDAGGAYILQTFGDKSFESGESVNFEPFSGYVAKVGVTLGLGNR